MKTDAIEDAFCRVETGDTAQARLQLSALLEANREMREALMRLAQADRLPPTRAYYFCEIESAKAQTLLNKLALGELDG